MEGETFEFSSFQLVGNPQTHQKTAPILLMTHRQACSDLFPITNGYITYADNLAELLLCQLSLFLMS
jgi:hypothetical protein